MVETPPNASSNYLRVTEIGGNTLVFDSTAAGQPVQNVVMTHTPTGAGYLTIANTVHLGGNLTVTGGPQQVVHMDGVVGGNFTYKEGVPGNNDFVYFRDQAKVGGNVVLTLGSGNNSTDIETGYFGGKLVINGGKDADNLYLSKTGDIFVAGSLIVNSQGGSNGVTALNAHTIHVGGSLNYLGGVGFDTIDFDSGGQPYLDITGSAVFNLGTTDTAANSLDLDNTAIGGNLTVVGSAGNDKIEAHGDLAVNKNAAINLGSGNNTLYCVWSSSDVATIAGALAVSAGAHTDYVVLDNLTVGKSATINLGDSDTDNQVLRVGTGAAGGVDVLKSLTIVGSSKKDNIELHRLYVGKSLTVKAGGGNDVLSINDTMIQGTSLFELGAGSDEFLIEMKSVDQEGDLASPTHFGGLFAVNGGVGDDKVVLSRDFDVVTYINFGAKLILTGGAGQDTLENSGSNFHQVTGNTDDFETLLGPALP